MKVSLDEVGNIGAVPDPAPESLPPEAWTQAVNVRCTDMGVETQGGFSRAMSIEVTSATTATVALSITPWAILPVFYGGTSWWIYAGANKVQVATATYNNTNITRQSATSTASIDAASTDKDYSASLSTNWSMVESGGVPIIAQKNDPPQYWYPPGITTRMQELDWDKSAGTKWSTRTAGAVTCEILRTFGNYVLALRTIENSTEYPRRMRWSHPSTNGLTPYTWDESKGAYLAGRKDFEGAEGDIVDAGKLGSNVIVYCQKGAHIARKTGDQYTFAFDPLRGSHGLFASRCWAEIKAGQHFVLTPEDLVITDGVSWDSIGAQRWRKTLFASIDQTHYRNTFCLRNAGKQELWICYPTNGSACTMALIWNWRYNTWYQRELGGVLDMALGVVQSPGSYSPLWDDAVGVWDDYQGTWDDYASDPRQLRLIAAHPGGGLYDTSLWHMDDDTVTTPTGGAMVYRLQRTGLAISGQSIRGKLVVDNSMRKEINGVWLKVSALEGSTISVRVGGQEDPSKGVNWGRRFDYVVGDSIYAEAEINTRYIAIEIVSSAKFRLVGYQLDMEQAGTF